MTSAPPGSGGKPRHGSGPGRPAVLIVDDAAANLIALEGLLRSNEIDVITAQSGEAALEILLDRHVAVAIVDVQMPEMGGFELAELIHGIEQTRDIPIIFVTAGPNDRGHIGRGYRSGAVDYLFKPIDEEVLRSKVNVFVTLEQNRILLEEAARMREMFIEVLGHDLRNPLGGILANAQLMQQSPPGQDHDELLRRVVRSGQRMGRLIEQLLDATRFRRDGRVVLAPKASNLEALTRQIVGEFEREQGRIHLEIAGDMTGTWDPDRVQQVLSNLLGNALVHSPGDSPVRVQLDGNDEDSVSLQVHNGGPPIPDELRETLFEPFRRVERGTNHPTGLGLGLFITHRLVEAHGGTISYESNERSGTRFAAHLPRHMHAMAERPEIASAPGKQSQGALDGHPEGRTILLVEDEESARLALERLLGDLGYHVVACADCKTALDYCNRYRGTLDVLLSDLRLPDMDGAALADRLRESQPNMGVVFVSGMPDPAIGDAAFLQKPIDLGALVDTIERSLPPPAASDAKSC